MNDDCIFCKIIKGELPSHKIYEDETTIAIMDIYPVEKGHVLVIPKEHCDPITETSDSVLQDTILTVKKVAKAQKKGLQAAGINIAQANGECAGQIIPHLHFHLIPREDGDPADRNWHSRSYDSDEETGKYADILRSAME